MLSFLSSMIIPLILVVLVIGVIVVVLVTGLVKAPPDTAVIISGFGGKMRILIGEAGIRIPFLQRKDELNLQLLSIDVRTDPNHPIPTNDLINVDVNGVAMVKISTDDVGIRISAQNFLNKPTSYISTQVVQVLESNVREIIGTMPLVNVMSDLKTFSDKVEEVVKPILKLMGLDLISFNIQTISDRNGVINNMGVANIAEIEKTAKIAAAKANSEVTIAQADADKLANDKQVEANLAIIEKNNEFAVRESELKAIADKKRAEADAVYEINNQTQRKQIEIEKQNANIASSERESVLAANEATVTEQRLISQVNKQADAELYKRTKEAEAKFIEQKKNAEAELYIIQQNALAIETEAKANKEKQLQEAEGIRAKGLAEADAIRAKGLAEAEATDKKADAMQKFGQAAITEMMVNVLPEIAKNVAEPLNNIGNITMYGEGNTSGMVRDITNSVSQISESLGIDFKSMLSGFVGGKVASPRIPLNETIIPTVQVQNNEMMENVIKDFLEKE